MKKSLVLLFFTLLFSTYSMASNRPCEFRFISECIEDIYSQKLDSSLTLNQSTKTKYKTRLLNSAKERSPIGLLQLTKTQQRYYLSLLQVNPVKSEKLRSRIIDSAAHTTTQEQTASFVTLALLEAFSGNSDKAKISIDNALKNSPENVKANVVAFIIAESKPYLDYLGHNLGYAENCQTPASQISSSLKILLSEQQANHLKTIHSIADTRLKLSVLFLLTNYVNQLNPCHFLGDFYTQNILQIIQNLGTDESSLEIAMYAKNSFRRQQGEN